MEPPDINTPLSHSKHHHSPAKPFLQKLYKCKYQMSLQTPNSTQTYSSTTSSSSWFRANHTTTLSISYGLSSQTNGDSIAIPGSSCQANPQDAVKYHQKSVGCSKRPCSRICGRDPKEAVCGSNIILEPPIIPATAQPCRGRVWLPSSTGRSNNSLQRGCLY